MKKALIHISVFVIIIASLVIFSFASGAAECVSHSDANGNGECESCGAAIDGASIFCGNSMSLADNINFMFWFKLEGKISNAAYVEFKVGERTEQIKVADSRKDGEHYVFTVELAARELSDTVIATFVYENGTRGTTYKISAKDYCKKILSDSESDNYKIYSELIIALMNYAGFAQEYFGYNTAVLANEGLFVGENPVLSANIPISEYKTTGTLPAGLVHQSATLVLESKIALRHYFVTENDISNYTFECDGKTLTPIADESRNVYYVEIANISPRSIDRVYTVSVNGTYSAEYGVLTYAYRQSIKGESQELLNLSKAIYLYNSAAEKLPSVLYYITDGKNTSYRPDLKDDGINLPTVPQKAGYEFDGWYSSTNKSTKLTSPPSDDFDGVISAYGRYRFVFHDVSDVYTWIPDEDGATYLTNKAIKGNTSLADEAITYVFSISVPMKTDEEGNKVPDTFPSQLRVRNAKTDIISVLSITESGVVTLTGDDTIAIGTLSDVPTEIYLVVDFKNQMLISKTAGGDYVSTSFSLSAQAASLYANSSEWFNSLNADTRAFQWRAATGDGVKRIYVNNCKVFDGKDYGLDELIAEQWREYYQNVKDKVDDFNNADFGPSITLDMVAVAAEKGSTFATPSISPASGEHPRVMVTADMLPAIKAAMENPDNSAAVNAFWKMANKKTDGILPPAYEHTRGRKGVHNFDYAVLDSIQAKAFAYLLTGEDYYAYEAIYAIKNYILTLDIEWIHSDQTREFGYTMYIAACVYDWCYDKLSENDKFQIAAGIEHRICSGTTSNTVDSTYGGVKMEMGFPPTKQGSVTSHGSERQLLRDYMSFAIAVYDELPSWWNYIGGRFYADFIPVRNEFYKSGMYPQGTSVYVSGRFMSDLYSAVLIKALTGENPYSADMKNVIHSIVSHEAAEGNIFATGDGTINVTPYSLRPGYGYDAILSSYVNNDPIALAIAKEIGNGFSKFGSGSESVTPAVALICLQSALDAPASYRDELPMITYNGGFLGQMITRNKWAPDAAVTLMKISERTTANHDHQAAGTFQIYYKGMLTADTGSYDSYGTNQHKYFHQATISHNGLLIYNPAMKNENNGFYSGGQRRWGETSNLSGWMSSTYKTADVTAVSYAYDENGSPVYSYLAGDITPAYDAVTVDYVGRTMLTAYTGNADIPMVFFVFDRIDADSADFKKTFLLQIPGADEPVVDSSAKTVTVVNGDGKLVLKNILGGDSITKLGGEGQNYLVNGTQIGVIEGENTPKTWGRVEISPNTGNKSDLLLNVIYVTDKNGSAALTPSEIAITSEYGIYKGAVAGNIAAVFNADTVKSSESLSFETTGNGDITYYIGGLAEGTWNITAGGKSFSVNATEEAGLITFTAPAGEVTLVPSEEIIPENALRIKYQTNGGVFDGEATEHYFKGTVTKLPENISKPGCIFAGWYRDAALTIPISEIPATETAPITVFAKWKISFVDEDYSESIINYGNSEGGTYNGLEYSRYDTSSYISTTQNGGVLTWTTTADGPSIFARKSSCGKSIADMESDVVIYRFELAKGSGTPMNFSIRVRDGNSKETRMATASGGVIKAGSKGKTLMTLTEEMQEIYFVLDFAKGEIYCYNSSGILAETIAMSPPDGYATAAEWRKNFTNEVLSMRANGAGEIRIGSIEIFEAE